MSVDQIVFTGFESRLKNHQIIITAEGPDEKEASITLEGDEIRQFYGLNCAAFLEKFGDDIKELESLFMASMGIKVSND